MAYLTQSTTSSGTEGGGSSVPGAIPSASSSTDRGESPRLLIVEDNWEARQLMALLLKEYDVELTAGADAALEKAQSESFDLVIADINLGYDRSGVELLEELREIPGYEHVPVVAVTAYALPGDRNRLVRHGFTDYLAKPFDPEALLNTIERALGSQS